MLKDLLPPREVAEKLGLSTSTITRCVQKGAPVHRWGSTGHRYRINIDEFVRWMERQGEERKPAPAPWDDVEEMARRRRASVRGISA